MYRDSIDHESFTEKFHGIYRGVVENNNDPKQAGRIQIRVMPMFANVDVSTLPWAVYADPFGGGSPDIGGFFIPEDKSNVFCFFENGDHRYPVYFAGAPSMHAGKPDLPEETRKTTYTQNRVIRTKSGIVIELDDSDGAIRFQITHPSGTTETIDNSGNLNTLVVKDNNLTIKGNYNISVSGDATLSVKGNLKSDVSGDTDIKSSGLVNITGTLINLNGT